MARTLGVIESHTYSDVISAADRAAKAADVRLVRYEKIGEDHVAAIFEGSAENVRIALDAASSNGHNGNLTVTFLPNVPRKVLGSFKLPGGTLWRW